MEVAIVNNMVVVRGNTYRNRGMLRDAGGVWDCTNRHWLFPLSQKEQIEEMITGKKSCLVSARASEERCSKKVTFKEGHYSFEDDGDETPRDRESAEQDDKQNEVETTGEQDFEEKDAEDGDQREQVPDHRASNRSSEAVEPTCLHDDPLTCNHDIPILPLHISQLNSIVYNQVRHALQAERKAQMKAQDRDCETSVCDIAKLFLIMFLVMGAIVGFGFLLKGRTSL